MRSIYGSMCVTLLLAGVLCWGASPNGKLASRGLAQASEEVTTLVARLGNDDWKTRQEAQDRLVLLGDEVEQSLARAAEESEDDEQRTRAEAALRAIRNNRVSGPSIITLRMTDVTPETVFAELSRQAYARLSPFPARLWQQREWPTISVNIDHQPFWSAMKELCPKVGVFPQMMGAEQNMMVAEGANDLLASPSVASGPFLIVAESISRNNQVQLAQPEKVDRDFQVQLTALAEPKLRILRAMSNVTVEEAVDNKGNSLIPAGASEANCTSGSGWSWTLSARLAYPPDTGTMIARLRGTARFLVETHAQTVEIPDILTARNVTRAIGSTRITLGPMKKRGEQYAIDVTIQRGNLDDEHWQDLCGSYALARLEDVSGRSLTVQNIRRNGEDKVLNCTLTFSRETVGDEDSQPGPPGKLILAIPDESKEVAVTFEFTNLPIP